MGVWTIAPDLAVEIVSPNDLAQRSGPTIWPNDLIEEVEAKIHAYFAAGVQQVWLVAPQFQTVTICASPLMLTLLQAGDELTSPELLPGFRCPVAALFQPVVHA